jgi:LPXTG-motif cell wall-anchored protein
VTYTSDAAAAPGATVTVTATAQEGYVLSGQTQWTHTFAVVDQNQCVESEAVPPTTDAPTTTEAPTTTADVQQESEAPTTTVAPTTQLPKTGNDHVTLVSLLAALLLGGGVAMSAVAARRRN